MKTFTLGFLLLFFIILTIMVLMALPIWLLITGHWLCSIVTVAFELALIFSCTAYQGE